MRERRSLDRLLCREVDVVCGMRLGFSADGLTPRAMGRVYRRTSRVFRRRSLDYTIGTLKDEVCLSQKHGRSCKEF